MEFSCDIMYKIKGKNFYVIIFFDGWMQDAGFWWKRLRRALSEKRVRQMRGNNKRNCSRSRRRLDGNIKQEKQRKGVWNLKAMWKEMGIIQRATSGRGEGRGGAGHWTFLGWRDTVIASTKTGLFFIRPWTNLYP